MGHRRCGSAPAAASTLHPIAAGTGRCRSRCVVPPWYVETMPERYIFTVFLRERTGDGFPDSATLRDLSAAAHSLSSVGGARWQARRGKTGSNPNKLALGTPKLCVAACAASPHPHIVNVHTYRFITAERRHSG